MKRLERCFLAAPESKGPEDWRPAQLHIIGSAGSGITGVSVALLNGERRAFLKNAARVDDSDDLELVLNFIGRKLGVGMAEEYRVLALDGRKLALLSMDVGAGRKAAGDGGGFREMRKLQAEAWAGIRDSLTRQEAWVQEWLEITSHPAFPRLAGNHEYACRSDADCRAAFLLPLRYLRTLYPDSPGELDAFREEYLRMILFDLLTGQTDRTTDNYGLLTGLLPEGKTSGPGAAAGQRRAFRLAPLFDNGTLQKPYLSWEQYSLNGMVIERERLCRILSQETDGEARRLAAGMLARCEACRASFEERADYWIENEGRELLRRRLCQGTELLGRIH